MTAARNKRPGYTLVELLIVVALIGILASVMIGSFNPSIHDELSSAAQIVAADLAYARSLAVTNNSTYRWTFETSQNRWRLDHSGANTLLEVLPASPFRQTGDPPDRQTTDLDELPHAGPVAEIVSVHSLAGTPVAVSDIEFGPLGGTTRPVGTAIWLGCGSGAGRRYVCVSVDPITGLATLGDLQVAPPPLAAIPAGGAAAEAAVSGP